MGANRVWLGLVSMAAWASAGACGQDGGRDGGDGSGVMSIGSDTAGGDTDSGADAGSGASGDGDSQGSGGSGDGGNTKFDLGGIPEGPDTGGCGGGNGAGVELSYIWIANSSQGTISKIDTQTIVEEGRYYAKPSGGDPSRTSVNLNGDVAVANRNGGVAKFWANPMDCQENNGVPGIQTSTGAGDILPWGQDECLAWYTELTCSSNRPVAWTRGTFDDNTCGYTNAKVWTACNNNVHLLDGETGLVEDTIVVPGSPFVYGGAADADGNFWGLDTSGRILFRVDFESRDLQSWPLPASGGYGITVDPAGRPWVCGGGGVSRFNLATADWSSTGTGGIGGRMTDGADLIWHSVYPSGTLRAFNIDTLNVDQELTLPAYVHGVSVDFYGYVWGVGFASNNAYRADPTTGDVQTYSGLTGAYTYSDMTGFALNSAGGGAPPG
jgi:hypothetical protein